VKNTQRSEDEVKKSVKSVKKCCFVSPKFLLKLREYFRLQISDFCANSPIVVALPQKSCSAFAPKLLMKLDP